jgi:hypothetical protein
MRQRNASNGLRQLTMFPAQCKIERLFVDDVCGEGGRTSAVSRTLNSQRAGIDCIAYITC